MRVCLVGEGTYPVVRGGVSTWSDQLVRGLPDVEFDVTVLTAGRAQAVYDLPPNVRRVCALDMWGPVPARKHITRQQRLAFEEAWEIICGHAYGRAGRTASRTLEAWLVLSRPDIAERLWWLLNDRRALALLSQIRQRAEREPATGRDLAGSMAYVARMIMPVMFPPAPADVVHVTSLGSAMLAALPSYREGIPILLSEHGVFFRERMMALRGTEWSYLQRSLVADFLRSITRIGYEASASVAPVSDFNGRWAVALGADAEKVGTIHNGVDLALFPYSEDEPEVPTITFVGRIDPLKDLVTLICAVPSIVAAHPDVQVRLVGPVPDTNLAYADELATLIEELGVADHVSMPGPTTSPAAAYAAGTISVLSSISEGFPYGALEPMACGRPLVGTAVGGVPEVVGDAGLLVHAREPEALAEACIRLLEDEGLRARLRVAGRRRVEEQFALDLMVDGFRTRYASVVDAARAPQPVAIPRPRGERVGVGDRVMPYLPAQRDPEWAYALIKAKAGG